MNGWTGGAVVVVVVFTAVKLKTFACILHVKRVFFCLSKINANRIEPKPFRLYRIIQIYIKIYPNSWKFISIYSAFQASVANKLKIH